MVRPTVKSDASQAPTPSSPGPCAEPTASASPTSDNAQELAAEQRLVPDNSTHTSQRTNGSGARSLADIATATQLRDPTRYRILGEHGRGGLGRVTRVHDIDLGRDIAIKELISRGPISELRFLREALITARLEHPGIVPVHEAGRWPDGTPFYAMKLVAGRPLRDLIAERRSVDERIGLLHHVIAVADAIAYAHGRNIIHRDLKPSNVIVGDYGETVVIDWGLAKDLTVADESPDVDSPAAVLVDSGLTSAGTILGTPAYMAPEQARGEPADKRADVFAIGAMLWELCTIEKLPPAYSGQRRRILRRTGIDQDLGTIIAKAVDPDPSVRYPDAGALTADLKAFKAGARIAARRYSPWARLTHWARRHRAAAFSIAGAVVAVAVAAMFYLHNVSAERKRAELAWRAAQTSKAAAVTALAERKLADARAAQAALEQGRAALLHGEAEAQARLTEAYGREPSPSTAFMLARAIQPRLQQEAEFPSTHGRMWSATFSPDGTQIVTTDDGAAQIWDRRTHALHATLSHGCEVYHAVYTTDGGMLVTVGKETVRVWDPKRGVLLRELLATPNSHGLDYYRAAVSLDGRFLAVIDADGSDVHVWSLTTGDLLAELQNDPAGWPSIAFGSNAWLATTGGKSVRIFDTRTWAQLLVIAGPMHVLALDSHSHLVTGAFTGDVTLWEVPSGKRLRQLRLAGESVDAVAASSDGQFVAAAARDGAVLVWRTASGALRSRFNTHHGKVLAIEFDPRANLLLTADSDGTVVVADAAQGLPVVVLEGSRNAVLDAHFDSSGSRVLGASWDGTARLWYTRAVYRQWTSEPIAEDCGVVTTPEPQSRYVVVDCQRRPVRVWDTARDELLAELPSKTLIESGGFTSAFPVVSADGSRVAIAQGDVVQVHELPGARLLRSVAHGAPISAIAFSPSNRDLISGAVNGTLIISRDDGTERRLPTMAGIDAVALLPDGGAAVSDAERRFRAYSPEGLIVADLGMPKRLMSLRRDGHRIVALPNYNEATIPPQLIDLETRHVVELLGHVGNVYSARWIQGTRILTAGTDGTVRMWDGVTGRQLTMFEGGARFLADATLLADTVVVAGDADGLLRFWDAASGAKLWTMQAHRSHVIGVHVEGGDIVTRSFTGEVTRWRIPSAQDVIDACRRQPACAQHQ